VLWSRPVDVERLGYAALGTGRLYESPGGTWSDQRQDVGKRLGRGVLAAAVLLRQAVKASYRATLPACGEVRACVVVIVGGGAIKIDDARVDDANRLAAAECAK